MVQEAMETKSITSIVQGIDDKTMRSIMEYFHFEDYDDLIRYATRIGITPSKLSRVANSNRSFS